MELYRMNAIEQQMAEDLRWAMTAPEVQQHVGQYVIVHKKRVIAAGRDHDAAVAEAAAKEECPWDDLVVIEVPRLDLDDCEIPPDFQSLE